jgi:hypothetical protein
VSHASVILIGSLIEIVILIVTETGFLTWNYRVTEFWIDLIVTCVVYCCDHGVHNHVHNALDHRIHSTDLLDGMDGLDYVVGAL